MIAGKLRHRVTIQRMTETQNDYGETTQTWSDFAVSDASISPLSGREAFQAMQMQADVTHKVVTRYVAGVTPRMRLTFGERLFNIESVINSEERNIQLELLCKESL